MNKVEEAFEEYISPVALEQIEMLLMETFNKKKVLSVLKPEG